jgi:hypothetical protein
MSSSAQSSQPEAETHFIESLRSRYEDRGFTFIVHPKKAQVPDFLGSYVPDALALKPDRNIAIEVKRRQGPVAERSLKDIRRLFLGHPDWQFDVIFMGADPLESVSIPIPTLTTVHRRMEEVRTLISIGEPRPAFIMAWSLLEAALRVANGGVGSRPQTPGTVVQTLAMNGHVDPDMERRLRDLIDLRNHIAHGDLTAEPADADVELLLAAIEQTLRPASQ